MPETNTSQTVRRAESETPLALVGGVAAGLLIGGLAVFLVLKLGLGWGGGGVSDDGSAGGEGGMAGGPPPAQVRTGEVQQAVLRERVALIGRLEEVRRVTVTAEVEGRITDLSVREGDAVVGGATVLARIDRVWADLNLRSAEADLAAAGAELKQARADLEQLERLSAARSAKDKEVEDQRTRVAERAARYDAAVAARDRAATEWERADIAAPFDGAVARTLVEVGRWVQPGDGVAEIISTGAIDAVVDAPESVVNRLVRDDQVEVVVDALGARLVGRVVSIRPDGIDAARAFPVKVRLPDPEGRLRPGMSVTAHLPVTSEAEHTTVPRDAVLYSPAGAVVWYAMPAAAPPMAGAEAAGPPPEEPVAAAPAAWMAMSEPVRVLFGVGDRYAVEPLPGALFPALNPGTRVVVEGAERLFPTQPLLLDVARD